MTKNKKSNPVLVIIALCVLVIPIICVAVGASLQSCKSSALYCVEDKALLDGKNTDERVAPASLTKLMTACVALRTMSADEVITVGTERKLVKKGSSVCFILQGHRLKLYDLISGMIMVSGNDAAYTVAVAAARRAGGDELSDEKALGYFSQMMNDLAAELGMDGTHFVNPDGWDDPEHYTTVSDLIKLAEYSLTFPEIREIARTRSRYVVFESGENITWENTNKLIYTDSRFYRSDAIGLKTGTTNKAGNCLVGAFIIDGKTYITAVMGCGTDNARYRRTLDLLELVSD